MQCNSMQCNAMQCSHHAHFTHSHLEGNLWELCRAASTKCSTMYKDTLVASLFLIWWSCCLIGHWCHFAWSGGCLYAREPIRTCSSQGGTGITHWCHNTWKWKDISLWIDIRCEYTWNLKDLSCIEWEVFCLQGGDELHSFKVRVDREEVPEVAHFVPEASWYGDLKWRWVPKLSWCHLVKFSLVRHQRWKLTVTGNDVNWSITWGERCNQAAKYFLTRIANGKDISWKYLVPIMENRIYIIGGASWKLLLQRIKENSHHWKRFQAACSPPTPLPAQGAEPVPGSCT